MAEVTDETRRLAALDAYELLDTPTDAHYDAIVAQAAAALATPMSAITLVDQHRQWYKARVGIAERETPRAQSFCARAIEGDGMFVVNDASRDRRFRDFATVAGDPHVRFYAGAPLTLRDGTRVGTLCVIDVAPRDGLAAEDALLLQELARRTVAAFELERGLAALAHGRAPAPVDGGRAVLLEEAAALLLRASAALERADASVPLAHLEQVIALVDDLRRG